jgi:hypothetical protein
MLSPMLLLIIDPSALQSPSRTAALKGLILYAILAASDGALNFLPTMAFYWFTYMIYLFGWPGTQPAVAAQPAPMADAPVVGGHSLVEAAH